MNKVSCNIFNASGQFLIVILLGMILSCENHDENDELFYPISNVDIVQFSYGGSTQNIEIRAEEGWIATTENEWIFLNESINVDATTDILSITVDRNLGDERN